MLRSSVASPSAPYSFLSCRWSFLPKPAASVRNFSGTLSDHSCSLSYLAPPICATGYRAIAKAVGEDVEEEKEVGGLNFIEVGYITGVHGLKGELRVKPNTGFPELRFCKPGRRWLKARILGKETISEMELTRGRSHPGQKCWIISFEAIDTVDKAKQVVGSTILVREEDKPELEEDEFYSHDLVGMRVLHKDTGILVGKVANVLNTGANDLLHVKRYSCEPSKGKVNLSDSHLSETDVSGQFLWIPFVKAIVPDIDMERREMIITPPKGLLELNLRSDMRSKKERRQMEWKLRKRLQQRFTAAKKILQEMGHSHLFDGFSIGDKGQRAMLARHIADLNLSLFQHAVRCVEASSRRLSLFDFVDANSDLLLKNALMIPYKYLRDSVYPEKNDELFKEGLRLLNNSKAAIILVINDDSSLGMVSNELVLHKLQQLLADYQSFLKFGEKCNEIPFIMLTSTGQTKPIEQLLVDNDYFGFNAEKVLLLEETRLPIVSKSVDSKKILLKSSWEILLAPTGSGGTFASLLSQKGVDFLQEMGVEYVQVCSLSERSAFGSPLFFGWASSCEAKMALKIPMNTKEEDNYDIIFSAEKLRMICKQIEALSFQAIPEQHEYVEQVDGEWTKVKPSSFNSFRLHCSIYSALKLCSVDEVCVMQVLE
ncbi:uncharacterized protein LOC110093368 isoform X1 [Dendrobium catenatum]|uniref:UDP-N-acetylglucosamine diphosphorylase 2 n=1 Tax=Dendrobium catenatum TaxID=906689 RepID=A0A2I0WCN2_9ASPA|nr:uncharacterized protein LOC110093368 isoform X1 [Dendrobium catenatum]PKU73429.1 UDP-N-acetylglucosamine diphosphorylase 2 [Dendrobium catenatum]